MLRTSPASSATVILTYSLEVRSPVRLCLCFWSLYRFHAESKYSHAAVWPLLSGYDKDDGSRSYPLAAMVANLAKPTPSKPALMRHDDVVTFFHEMGHVFHGLLSRTKFARFHGTAVARDFVEAPSQMLENWCWEPRVLEKMSSHFERKEPLPADLIEKIIKRCVAWLRGVTRR